MKIFEKSLPLCCLLFSIASTQVHNSAGTRAYSFLNIDYNAYSVAMGGAAVAVPGGSNDIMNPAGQGFGNKSLFFLSYYPIFDDIRGVSLGISRELGKYGIVALSAITLSSGEFEVIEDNNGQPDTTGETAGMNSFAGGLSWAYKFNDNFSFGLTCRGIFENISDPENSVTSGAIGFDAGVQYRFYRNRVVIGGLIKNAGYLIKSFNGTRYKMPVGVEAGVSYVPKNFSNLRLAFDLSKRAGDFLTIRPGLELYIYEKILAIRLGFPFSTEDLRNLGDNEIVKTNNNGFAVGIGLNPKIKNVNTRFNMALQLKSQGLQPSFLVSNSTEF